MSYSRSLGLALLLLLISAAPAWAVIEKLTKLADLVRDANGIAVAKVEKVSEKGVVLVVNRDLKGNIAERRWTVSLAGASATDATALQRRLAPGVNVVLFDTDLGADRIGLLYTNGSWFSLSGQAEGERVRWRMTQAEPYFVRTYRDTTDALATAIADTQSGKATLPGPDAKLKPGLGPELAETPPATVEAPASENKAAPAEVAAPRAASPDATPVGPSRLLLAGLVVVATIIALAFNLR